MYFCKGGAIEKPLFLRDKEKEKGQFFLKKEEMYCENIDFMV